MPRYQWVCAMCKMMVEVDRSVDERNEPISCPMCKAEMGRVVGAPGFALKGDGWTRPTGWPKGGE